MSFVRGAMTQRNEVSAPVQILDWDSQFFGKKIGRVASSKLNPRLAAEINVWSEKNRVDCLYFLAASDDPQTSQTAENDGYHLVDIRVTLQNKLKEPVNSRSHSDHIRPVNVNDIESLRIISRNNHRDSRFYYDGHFVREKCDELYAVWIEKNVHSGEDQVLIWEENQQPVAYVTGKITPVGSGSIELVGVHPAWQGKGIGYQLTMHLLAWFQQQHSTHVTVVTQGRNIGAQVLYQRCGFVTVSTELWYHKWFLNR